MAAFHRFFKGDCGYAFTPVVRTLQGWFSAYQNFVNERERRTSRQPLYEPQGARERKFAAIEALAEWMRGRFSYYGLSIV